MRARTVNLMLLAAAMSVATVAGCAPENNAPSGENALLNTGGSSGGTAPAPAAPPADPVVATVRGQRVTLSELNKPLIQGYGLKVLLELVELDLVKQEAAAQNVTVTADDVKAEYALTLAGLKQSARAVDEQGNPLPATQPENLSPEETDRLLNQVLAQRQLTRADFDVILTTSAYLRKIAVPQVVSHVGEEQVRARFNEEYGEKLQTRYIVLSNRSQTAQVQAFLAAGGSFEAAARKWSIAPDAKSTGGELPPFSRQDNRFPPEFIKVAFDLKDGQVSDLIEIKDLIYLVQAERHIDPAVAKYEDYRESVRKDLIDQLTTSSITVMRAKLAQVASQTMHIEDPTMAEQWQDQVDKAKQAVDKAEVRRKMDEERNRQRAGASTEPSATGDLTTSIGPARPARAAATTPAANGPAPAAPAAAAPAAAATAPAAE